MGLGVEGWEVIAKNTVSVSGVENVLKLAGVTVAPEYIKNELYMEFGIEWYVNYISLKMF